MQPGVASELDRYHRRDFDLTAIRETVELPLPDEPFVACWRQWASEVEEGHDNAFTVLARHLPQLRFPIREGMSTHKEYRAATLAGADPDTLETATGLVLEQPEALELHLHATAAGHIPLLVVRRRREFETLLRALCRRGEPATIRDAQGAQMVAGFNNWGRLRALQREWQEQPAETRQSETWNEEFARIKPQKHLYQDRFILLSDGPYGAVPAGDLGLDENSWRAMSLILRREHESAHYLTRRLLGSMRNHALDELLADYAGLAAAAGRFRAEWFLRCIGFETPSAALDSKDRNPKLAEDGRLHLYRGDPPLSDTAFAEMQRQLCRAAWALEEVDQAVWSPARGRQSPESEDTRTVLQRTQMILALAGCRLDQLAQDGGAELLHRRVAEVSQSISWRNGSQS